MNVLGYLPNFEVRQCNELAILLAGIGIPFKAAESLEQLTADMDICNTPVDFVVTEDAVFSSLPDYGAKHPNCKTILFTHKKLNKISPSIASSQQIHSFMTLNGGDRDLYDIFTMFQKYYSSSSSRKSMTTIFGIEHYLRACASVKETLVTNVADKALALDLVSNFVLALGNNLESSRFDVYASRVRGLLDELVLNAVFDANARLRQTNRNDAFLLTKEESILVRWGFDGVNFAVSVTDPFGMLKRETVINYLTRVIDANEVAGRRSGGMGLQFVYDRVHQVVCNVQPGSATEIICTMNFESRLKEFDARGKAFHYFSVPAAVN